MPLLWQWPRLGGLLSLGIVAAEQWWTVRFEGRDGLPMGVGLPLGSCGDPAWCGGLDGAHGLGPHIAHALLAACALCTMLVNRPLVSSVADAIASLAESTAAEGSEPADAGELRVARARAQYLQRKREKEKKR